MTHRQRQALAHPERYTKEPTAPHKRRVEKLGQTTTILTVSERLPGTWVWHASVSLGRKPLWRWTAKMAARGDEILRKLLAGVGGQVVFGVKPHHELETWELDGLEQWQVINDGDAVAHVHESLGYQLPVPPSQFLAMHLWKELTEEEVATIREAMN